MNYELAKKLKEAKFPQGKSGLYVYFGDNGGMEIAKPGEKLLRIPTRI